MPESTNNNPVIMDRVEIDAGICTRSDNQAEVGLRIYMVNLVDREGYRLADYAGIDRDAADRAAVALARDFNIRIDDKTSGGRGPEREFLCLLPGPYGKPIPAYVDPTGGDKCILDLEGSMDMAGIHSPELRAQCAEAAVKADREGKALTADVFLAHGGRVVPMVAIGPPIQPTTPIMAGTERQAELRAQREDWTTLAMDAEDWPTRAATILNVLDGWRRDAETWVDDEPDGRTKATIALGLMLTTALEHLGERAIYCLEQAAFYALSAHREWREAAIEWLIPFRATWFRDWAQARPEWQALVQDRRTIDQELPRWLVAGGDA